MRSTMILTGDINFLGLEDAAVPFKHISKTLNAADIVFGNLECSFFEPAQKRNTNAVPSQVSGYEGLYVSPSLGEALTLGGFDVVGTANNTNYGADAIISSNQVLEKLKIGYAGAGADRAEAHAPVIKERNGVRFGFLQRTSIYWPTCHEAADTTAGVATLKAYTAYQVPYYKEGYGTATNRPGVPPKILTWTDADYLKQFKLDVAAAKQKSDFVVSSHHWGYGKEILQYQTEIAHAAIDSGADVVVGHGPHYPLAVEIYKNKPIFYGLGCFFYLRTNIQKIDGWVGMIAQITFEGKEISEISYSLVRQNGQAEVILKSAQEETETIAHIEALSKKFGTRTQVLENRVLILPG